MITKKLTGIKQPLQFAAGRLVLSHDDEHVKQSIITVLMIKKGEYLLNPAFGSDLYRRIFSPINLNALVRSDVKSALRKWERRINVNRVSASVDTANFGVVVIEVDYTFLNNFLQMSFNYVVEGR